MNFNELKWWFLWIFPTRKSPQIMITMIECSPIAFFGKKSEEYVSSKDVKFGAAHVLFLAYSVCVIFWPCAMCRVPYSMCHRNFWTAFSLRRYVSFLLCANPLSNSLLLSPSSLPRLLSLDEPRHNDSRSFAIEEIHSTNLHFGLKIWLFHLVAISHYDVRNNSNTGKW